MRFVPGYRQFVLPVFISATVVAVVFSPLGAVLLAVGAFVLWFFRDPERPPPDEPGVVTPVDGRVSVTRVEDRRVRMGVFVDVADVHVSRAPVSGSVRAVTHRPGAHKPAFSKDSDHNEHVGVELDTDADGRKASLIVDAFARRIRSYVALGDELVRGQKLGHVDLGSRADVLLPSEFGPEDVVVEKGESVRAGETVLIRRK